MYISFVIPAKDEQESVPILYKEILSVMGQQAKTFEIIFVDDGSTDETYNALKAIRADDKRVKLIRLRGNFGKSMALEAGFRNASGDVVITMDADLQDDPAEIPNFLSKLEEGYDLVSGWKKKRYDPLSKTIPSKVINRIARFLTGVPVHDTNCGFKAYRKVVVESLNLYGELYRFIPVFAAKENFRVGEIVVAHRARRFGKTKFGWDRGVKGVLDLITVVFLTGYLKRPGHFFGTIGISFFSIGFMIGLYITYLRLTTGGIDYRYPLMFMGSLLMIVGIQFVSTGLLAEMMISSKDNGKYVDSIILEKLD